MRFVSISIVMMLPLIASAQDTLFTPQHVAKLRFVTEAVISPDGTQVAYILGVPRDLAKEKDGGAWTELHVVDTKGNSTPFITGQVNVGSISWTPDGKNIAYLSKREKDKTRCLYAIGGRGGESRKLLEHATDIQSYSFSGDGKQVAFLATEPPSPERKKRIEQGFNQEVYEEDAPFVRVYVGQAFQPDDADPKRQAGKPDLLKLPGSASELHFNPKEDKLAVALAPTPSIDEHLMFRKVHIVEITSREREGAVVGKITKVENPGKLGQMAWSLDGKRLAIISAADKHDPMQGRLWIHTLGEKGWTHLNGNTENGHVESIAWGLNGTICIQASFGVETAVACVSTEKELPVGFTRSEVILSNLTVAPQKNAMAFLGHTAGHPLEVFYQGQDEGTPPAHRQQPLAEDDAVRQAGGDQVQGPGRPRTRRPLDPSAE